ncbi:hypothetical protein E4T47_06416 [Aureobasidium subglaciale]|nr:hypothetical protein E4T47_06416 [Aureobasidium subglaciale]
MGKREYEFDLLGMRNKGGKPRVLNSTGKFFAFRTLWDGFGHHRTTAWGAHLCFLFSFPFFILVCCLYSSFHIFSSILSVLFETRDTSNLVSCLSALSLETIHLEQWRLEVRNTRLLSCGLGPRASHEQEVGSVHRVSLQHILFLGGIKLYSTICINRKNQSSTVGFQKRTPAT